MAEARSEAKVWVLEIERLKLLLAKVRRENFGQSSERGKHLIEQLELAIVDLMILASKFLLHQPLARSVGSSIVNFMNADASTAQ